MTHPHDESPDLSGLSSAHRSLLKSFLEGKRGALARSISVVENERTGFQPLMDALLRVGRSGGSRAGITGPPGAGKSTLVAALARRCREEGSEVGVVAVDPTSPFSGGALLGDRIRMNDIATDPGIFIRSMASRGSLGGLATTTKEVLDVMDAFGFPRLLVETVGVGQAELEITGATDSVVVVLVPESGDGVQAMKAGLMEVADIFVVNKSDRPGADRLVKEIRLALQLRQGEGRKNVPAHHGVEASKVGEEPGRGKGEDGSRERAEEEKGEGADQWKVPIVSTVAQSGEGVPDLLQALDDHREYLIRSGELQRRLRERARRRVRDVVDREARRLIHLGIKGSRTLEAALDDIVDRKATPYTAARQVLEELGMDEGAERLPETEEMGL